MTRKRQEEDLRAELESHLRMATEAGVDRGLSPRAAAEAARRDLGNLSQIQEATRDVWGRRWLERLGQDLRYALRVFNRNRTFTAVAIISLALGIGANAALFQVVNAIRLRALPVADPASLVEVHIADMDGARGSFQTMFPSVTFPIWQEIERRQQAFTDVFAWNLDTFNLADGGEVRLASAMWVTGGFFDGLGLRPAAGRLFNRSDDVTGCAPRAVLSHAFWQRAYGGNPAIIGQTLTLNVRPVEIVGVAPAGFEGLDVGRTFDVAVPFCAEPGFSDDGRGRVASGTTWWTSVFGRLKPGWTVTRAAAHVDALSPALFASTVPPNYPVESVERYKQFRLTAEYGGAGVSEMRDAFETPLWLLLGISGLVLVIACANLANLLLARATARQREIAIRLGLGASRGRIVRQLLTESLLLAILGAGAGLLLARWLGGALVGFLNTANRVITLPLTIDWRVALFTAGLAALTCVLFGLAPALRATRVNAESVMRGTARGQTASREAMGLRRSLVVAQIALSIVLLFGSLLFVRSLHNAASVNPGFDARNVVLASVNFGRLGMVPERRAQYRRDLVDRIRGLPGVQSAALLRFVPVSGESNTNDVWPEGDRSRRSMTHFNTVGSGFFATLAIPFVAGRDFDDRDTTGSSRVAIVDETFVSTVLGGRPAIGARFTRQVTPATPETTFEIIGVVRNSTYSGLKEATAPVAFLSDAQGTPVASMRVAVRSSLPPAAVTAAMTRSFAELDSRIALRYSVMQEDVRDTLRLEQLMATISSGFGLLAAVLTLVGLYGVVAYTVARRTNEIGVRMALGARAADIVRLVLRETGVVLSIGVVLGVALAIAAGREAATLLFGVPPHDPQLLLIAVGLLGVIALAATVAPARRATRIEPVTALRVD